MYGCEVNVAQRRQDKTLSMRPMGEGLDVRSGGFSIHILHSKKYLVLDYRVLGLMGDQAER